MYMMKTTTATSLRKELFRVLERAAHAVPTRVHYKKGDAVILSYNQYRALRGKKKGRKSKILSHLIPGKIKKPLNKKADLELLDYVGLL